MSRYAIYRADGGVSIMQLNDDEKLPGQLKRWSETADPSWLPIAGVVAITQEDLPPRKLRNAWRHGQGSQALSVDMPHAREIVLGLIRAERDQRLTVSDGEQLKLEAIGTAIERDRLADHRQRLRDLPAVVKREIANLTALQLDAYQPPWPGE